jgi:hypothetical protein
MVVFGSLVGPAPIGVFAQEGTPGPQTTPTPAPQTTPAAPGLNQVLAATPTATPTPTPGGGCDWLDPGTCVQNFINQINFDFGTMFEAVLKMLNQMLEGAYQGITAPLSQALDIILFSRFGIAPAPTASPNVASADGVAAAVGGFADTVSTPLFAELIWPHWLWTMAVAAALIPLTLSLTVVDALKQGAESTMSMARLQQNLISWGVTALLAASSYVLLSIAFKLVASVSYWVLTNVQGDGIATSISNAIFPTVILSLVMAAIQNPMVGAVTFFLGTFLMVLGLALIVGLLFALTAIIAIVYLVTVLAPIIIVLGQLEPLRWLHELWAKAVVISYLLPLANVLALAFLVMLVENVVSGEGWVRAILSVVVATAVISLILVIDYGVGKAVFEGVHQVAQQYLGAMQEVGRLLAATAVFAASGLPIGFAGIGSGNGPGSGPGGPSSALTRLGTGTGMTKSGGVLGSAGSETGGDEKADGFPSGASVRQAATTGPSGAGGAGGSKTQDRVSQYRSLANQSRLGNNLRAAGNLLAASRVPALSFAGQMAGGVGSSMTAGAEAERSNLQIADQQADRAQGEQRYQEGRAERAQSRQEQAEYRTKQETRQTAMDQQRLVDRTARMTRQAAQDARQTAIDQERAQDRAERKDQQAARDAERAARRPEQGTDGSA